MDLSPVLTTALGGALALSGGFLSQRWSERRAMERESREREHEHEVWTRDQRHEAHLQFIAAFDRLYKVVGERRDSPEHSEPPDDFLIPLYGRLTLIRLVADEATSERAVAVIEALYRYTYLSGTWEDVEHSLDQYLGAVRSEFKFPPIKLMGE